MLVVKTSDLGVVMDRRLGVVQVFLWAALNGLDELGLGLGLGDPEELDLDHLDDWDDRDEDHGPARALEQCQH